MSDNVIGIFSRKRKSLKDEDDKDQGHLDLEEIARINAEKADKLEKDRQQRNKRVKREYRLKPKK